jgi:hypothetical protein
MSLSWTIAKYHNLQENYTKVYSSKYHGTQRRNDLLNKITNHLMDSGFSIPDIQGNIQAPSLHESLPIYKYIVNEMELIENKEQHADVQLLELYNNIVEYFNFRILLTLKESNVFIQTFEDIIQCISELKAIALIREFASAPKSTIYEDYYNLLIRTSNTFKVTTFPLPISEPNCDIINKELNYMIDEITKVLNLSELFISYLTKYGTEINLNKLISFISNWNKPILTKDNELTEYTCVQTIINFIASSQPLETANITVQHGKTCEQADTTESISLYCNYKRLQLQHNSTTNEVAAINVEVEDNGWNLSCKPSLMMSNYNKVQLPTLNENLLIIPNYCNTEDKNKCLFIILSKSCKLSVNYDINEYSKLISSEINDKRQNLDNVFPNILMIINRTINKYIGYIPNKWIKSLDNNHSYLLTQLKSSS